MSSGLYVSVLIDINWDFDGDDVNWQFCMEHATFVHKEACEFILNIGDAEDSKDGSPAFWRGVVKEMEEAGCTTDFVDTYVRAKDMGAQRVLFWS